jgi:uncharacterized SAM-binding protein YcdF (DUF218 family)
VTATGPLNALVFSTTGVVIALFAAAVWIATRPRSPAARRFLVVVAALYLIASVYAAPYAVAAWLARPYHRFEKPDVPPGTLALIVLGAGDEVVGGWDNHLTIPNAVGASRVLEAWRVYGIAHPAWVITSGGLPYPEDESEPSGTEMRRMLVDLGVPGNRIVAESTSRDTHENAVKSGAIARDLHADAVVLVTSAVHMARSVHAMRAAGWNPVPAIAPDSWFEARWRDWLLPSTHGLSFSGDVVHELIGIPYYRLRGWWR